MERIITEVKNPKVSVVCPVYNGTAYFRKCIDSMLAQTVQDLEIILVNDASTDNSLDILNEYRRRYPERITIVDYPDNRRVGGARNAGIRAAQADYIGFCDTDDFVSPSMYETLYDCIKKTGSDAVVVQAVFTPENCGLETVDRIEKTPYVDWNKNLLRWNGKDITGNVEAHEDLIAYEIGGVFCHLYKKSLITDNDVWFPEKISYEDNYFSSLICAYINKITFIPQVEYYYVQRSDSQTHQRNRRYHFLRIQIENSLLQEVKNRELLNAYYAGWEYLYTYRYAINTSHIICFMFDEPHSEELEQIYSDLKTNFPNWKKNRYYLEFNGSIKRRVLVHLMFNNRNVFRKLYPLYQRFKNRGK